MSLERRRVALIEDDPIMGESLLQRLSLEGATVRWWQAGPPAARELPTFRPDVVVCDLRLPELDGEALFRQTVGHSGAPFLFITAHADIDQAVRLMRLGGGDYLTKPFAMNAFLGRLKDLVRPAPPAGGGRLGPSPAMLEVETLLHRLADRPTTILLTGETGTGKEVCARFLHEAGGGSRSFLALNCAAIPANLVESEMFGHERGAFTGAKDRHRGYAERAGEGILFLDEIAELPLDLQAKLLRLLEERRFTRVGGSESLPFRARVVCATNARLDQLVREGRFREDLYYRIAVIEVAIPPLRERPEDIDWLLRRFVATFAEQHGEAPLSLADSTLESALAHDWPGNVRELRNRSERAVSLALQSCILPSDLFPERAPAIAAAPEASLASARDLAEKAQIERALARTGGHVPSAASLLGVSRSTLFEKLRRHGLGRKDRDGPT